MSQFDFKLILIDEANIRTNVDVPESLSDQESPTYVSAVKQFLSSHFRVRYTDISIAIRRKSRKVNVVDDTEIENEDEIYITLRKESSERQIPSGMRCGFENISERSTAANEDTFLTVFRSIIKADCFEYDGALVNGLPDGYGTMKTLRYTYVGMWKNGKYNGKGKITNYRGSRITRVYEGEFVNGEYEGHGTLVMYDSDGNIEIINSGNWKNGAMNGEGKVIEVGAFEYEGELRNDTIHGKGILRMDGYSYIGTFEEEVFVHGKVIYPNEEIYIGSWDSLYVSTEIGEMTGYRSGYGLMIYSNGDVYDGNWVKDKRCGSGKITYSDGSEIECQWKDDNIVE